ncbi:MFS transporter, partial [Streptomyces actuosus]
MKAVAMLAAFRPYWLAAVLCCGGAVIMAACMVATASLVKAHPPPPVSAESDQDSSIPGAAIATVLLIYLNITAFNLSWGPLPWPCISEIFPTRIREPGVALGV